MRPVHCATALVSLLSCAGAPTTVDSGLAPDAGVHVDAGLSDAGSTDAGVDDDSHECTLNLLTDAGRYCVSVTSVRDALTDEFGTPRVFVSSRHGDWSVLAHAETVHPDGGRTNVFASGVQSRDGSFRWIRRNIASAYDSDEAGNACGASDQTPGASPAY